MLERYVNLKITTRVFFPRQKSEQLRPIDLQDVGTIYALSILQVLLVGAKESIILCHLVSGKQENSDSTVGKSSGISQSEDIIDTIDEIYNKLVALV